MGMMTFNGLEPAIITERNLQSDVRNSISTIKLNERDIPPPGYTRHSPTVKDDEGTTPLSKDDDSAAWASFTNGFATLGFDLVDRMVVLSETALPASYYRNGQGSCPDILQNCRERCQWRQAHWQMRYGTKRMMLKLIQK
jgi:hypothetical protein